MAMTKGYKQTPEHIQKRIRRGPEHHGWAGDQVSEKGGRKRALRAFEARPCQQCGAAKSERHHQDGNTANNEESNIAMLCRRCHMQADGRLAAVKRIGTERIASLIELAAIAHRAKTTCKRGHALSGDNVYIDPKRRRVCKTCRKEHKKQYRLREEAKHVNS